jgi:ferrous iron transport protein B
MPWRPMMRIRPRINCPISSNALELPTALAFLAWFVFAPQCMSTIAVTRRETNGWKWPAFMLAYLFALAYVFAGITYWSAIALGF